MQINSKLQNKYHKKEKPIMLLFFVGCFLIFNDIDNADLTGHAPF